MSATQQEGLLQDILDNPADDTPRLVPGDWLEENDDEQDRQWAEQRCADPLKCEKAESAHPPKINSDGTR